MQTSEILEQLIQDESGEQPTPISSKVKSQEEPMSAEQQDIQFWAIMILLSQCLLFLFIWFNAISP